MQSGWQDSTLSSPMSPRVAGAVRLTRWTFFPWPHGVSSRACRPCSALCYALQRPRELSLLVGVLRWVLKTQPCLSTLSLVFQLFASLRSPPHSSHHSRDPHSRPWGRAVARLTPFCFLSLVGVVTLCSLMPSLS